MSLKLPDPDKRIPYLRYAFALAVAYAAIFIAAQSFVLSGQRYFCLFDDAMVSLRYAENLAKGWGLVWNPDERLEGYTNLLQVLIFAAIRLVFGKVYSILVIQILGVALVLGIAFVTARLFAETSSTKEGRWRLAALVGPLAYFPLLFWSMMGMETGLLTLLLASTMLCLVRYRTSGERKQAWIAAALGALAYLCRPDALLAVLWGIPWLYAASRRRGKVDVVAVAGFAAIVFLMVGGQLAFRVAYYGEWVPNTYLLKMTGFPWPIRVENGLRFVLPFMAEMALVATLAIWAIRRSADRQFGGMVLGIAGTLLAYQIYVGGDAWNYWRMLTPAFPLLWLLAVEGASEFRPAKMAWPALAAALGMVNFHMLPTMAMVHVPGSIRMNAANVQIGLTLKEITDEQASLGVFTAGAIGYYSERRVVDFLGKMDRVIASGQADVSGRAGFGRLITLPGHNKYNLEYSIKQLQPDFIERAHWGGQDLSEWVNEHYTAYGRPFLGGTELTFRLKKGSARFHPERLQAAGLTKPPPAH